MKDPYPKHYLYRRIVQAKLFIDSKYASAIDLSNISDEAFFSKYHFIRLFKKLYGRTPHQYLIYVRIEKAKELLITGLSVTEVCSEVGSESVGSFSSLFKRQVGMSPLMYQLKQRQIQNEISDRPLHFVPSCFAGKKGWK